MRGEENEAGLQIWAEARAHAIGIAAKWDRETGLGMPGVWLSIREVVGTPTEFSPGDWHLGLARLSSRFFDLLGFGVKAAWLFGLKFMVLTGLR